MDNVKHEVEKQRKKTLNKFIINNLLLLSCILTVISGLTLQLGYHAGEPGGHHGHENEVRSQPENYEHERPMQYEQERGIDTTKTIWGLRYSDWATLHRYTNVFFSLLMIYHIYTHWKWYKEVVVKHLIGKNIQITALSILFLLVALTGFIPWLIDLSGSTGDLRILFIELHDKLALILIIYFILHIIKKTKWYMKAYKKLIA